VRKNKKCYTNFAMSKNPLINGLAAFAYIFVLGSGMNWATRFAPRADSFMVPVAVISLFTLSAAVMGYLFCYTPIQLYFDKKKKQAITLFLQTVGVFACFTILALLLVFSGLIH